MTIAVVLTCYNRKNMTVNCIERLFDGNPELELAFFVVDDGSSDGTGEALEELRETGVCLNVFHGNGSLYWNGGMRLGLEHVLSGQYGIYDFVLLVNDDVEFENGCIAELLKRYAVIAGDVKEQAGIQYQICRDEKTQDMHLSEAGNAPPVIVGSTVSESGEVSYGGIICTSGYLARFCLVEPSEAPVRCDTFNANCVLIPWSAAEAAGNLDAVYRHSMGDFDYGLVIGKKGFPIYNSDVYVGKCNDNAVEGSWRDSSLPRIKRIRLKESPKGLPAGDWFHFVNKHYGFPAAVYHSITPYIRILIGR